MIRKMALILLILPAFPVQGDWNQLFNDQLKDLKEAPLVWSDYFMAAKEACRACEEELATKKSPDREAIAKLLEKTIQKPTVLEMVCKKEKKTFFYIEFQTPIAKTSFNFDGCDSLSRARHSSLNHEGNIDTVHLWDAPYDLERVKPGFYSTRFNARPQPLEKIYANCPPGTSKLSPEEAIRLSQKKGRVLVAILDSGVDYNHPAIAYAIERPQWEKKERGDAASALVSQLGFAGLDPWSKLTSTYSAEISLRPLRQKKSVGWDFVEQDGEPYDVAQNPPYYHGTSVAEVVVRNSKETALLPIRREDEFFEEAVQLAHDRGARVINMSFSFSRNREKRLQYEKVFKKFPDILFVAAAGNEGKEVTDEMGPTGILAPNLITVAAVEPNGEMAKYSNWSATKVHLAGQLSAVPSLAPLGVPPGKEHEIGTSFAAPIISAVAADMLSLNPNLSPSRIIELMAQSVDAKESFAKKVQFGGVLNPGKARRLAKESLASDIGPRLFVLGDNGLPDSLRRAAICIFASELSEGLKNRSPQEKSSHR